jgi:hypothetical protein
MHAPSQAQSVLSLHLKYFQSQISEPGDLPSVPFKLAWTPNPRAAASGLCGVAGSRAVSEGGHHSCAEGLLGPVTTCARVALQRMLPLIIG